LLARSRDDHVEHGTARRRGAPARGERLAVGAHQGRTVVHCDPGDLGIDDVAIAHAGNDRGPGAGTVGRSETHRDAPATVARNSEHGSGCRRTSYDPQVASSRGFVSHLVVRGQEQRVGRQVERATPACRHTVAATNRHCQHSGGRGRDGSYGCDGGGASEPMRDGTQTASSRRAGHGSGVFWPRQDPL